MDEVLALALRAHRLRDGRPRRRAALMSAIAGEPLVIRSLEFLGGMATADWLAPRADAAGGRVRRTLERREVVAAQRARAPEEVRARQQHAGTHARDQLLQGQRRSSCSSIFRATATRGSRRRRRPSGGRSSRATCAGARSCAASCNCSTRATTRRPTTARCSTSSSEIGVPTIVVLTKIDKLTAAQRVRRVDGYRVASRPRRRADDSVQRRDRRRAQRAWRGDRVALAQPSWRAVAEPAAEAAPETEP